MTSNNTTCDIEIRVRYGEVDQMGVVHHSRYWEYFEMGRTELLRQGGVAYRDVEEAGVLLVIAKCAAKFHVPARYDDLLVLRTTMTKMSAARIDHSYELKRKGDDTVLVTAETTLACVERNGRICPIPDRVRDAANRAAH
ncbi:MAG: acyl-CoA thioesterase [Planctomycetota bacterium]|jgi:acyl-CoA thioester hydrolase